MSRWEQITAEELRIAAKVAKASGGVTLSGAAAAWEFRADLLDNVLTKSEADAWLNGR